MTDKHVERFKDLITKCGAKYPDFDEKKVLEGMKEKDNFIFDPEQKYLFMKAQENGWTFWEMLDYQRKHEEVKL